MKIDVTKIEGYDEMSAEQKLAALEGYEMPKADYSGYVKKDVFDKTASELAARKKELNERMSEDEQRAQREQEEREDLQRKYDALMTESLTNKHKGKLMGLGYDETLAEDTAKALVAGDMDAVFKNQHAHQLTVEKRIRGEVLRDTPRPVGDGGGAALTMEAFRALDAGERLAFAESHPEDYKQLYEGGNA